MSKTGEQLLVFCKELVLGLSILLLLILVILIFLNSP